MKAVVTGGAGFIGSHLVDLLLVNDYEVLIIDNLCTGSLNNVDQTSKKISFINHDIRTPLPPDSFNGCSIVFHLAALADIIPSITAPFEYMEVNVIGTTRILEAARKAEVKRFIYAASSSCYGIPSEFPTKETCPPDPQYPYALSKYLGRFFSYGKDENNVYTRYKNL